LVISNLAVTTVTENHHSHGKSLQSPANHCKAQQITTVTANHCKAQQKHCKAQQVSANPSKSKQSLAKSLQVSASQSQGEEFPESPTILRCSIVPFDNIPYLKGNKTIHRHA